MEDEDRASAAFARTATAADMLARENLDPLSRDELDQRVALLEAEIARVRAHQDRANAHRHAADALFGRPSGG